MTEQMLLVRVLAFVQTVTFTMASRSHNRDHFRYPIIASIFSNLVWYLTVRELVLEEQGLHRLLPDVGENCRILYTTKNDRF